jgi:hypothetical protein
MTALRPRPIFGEQGGEIGPRVRLVPFDDIQLGLMRRYLVRSLIPRVGIIIIWGPPKSGKSFWTFDVVMHVALGWDYRGRRVQPGSVVYCAFEGQSGLEARVEAFRQRFLAEERDPVPFYLEPMTLDLVADYDELIAVVRRQISDRPAAVVLDTLNRSLAGSESSDEDMTAYVRAADAIREAFECAVIIVHHCGIDGTRPRGHTALTGAADAQIAIKRDAVGNIVATVELAKDGPQGDVILSRLEVVHVGDDEDGEAIRSCVVVPVDGGAVEQRKGRASLPATAQKVVAAFGRLIEAGKTHPAPSVPGVHIGARAITVSDLREMTFKLGLFPEPEPDEPKERERWRNSRNKAYRTGFSIVEKAGLLRCENGMVWEPADKGPSA